jgi:hypothetical protein
MDWATTSADETAVLLLLLPAKGGSGADEGRRASDCLLSPNNSLTWAWASALLLSASCSAMRFSCLAFARRFWNQF